VSDLREDWIKQSDALLADDEIVAAVYEALAKRHPKSRCRGRRGAPADLVLQRYFTKLFFGSRDRASRRGATRRREAEAYLDKVLRWLQRYWSD
jgi:hypothetical protein